MMTSLAGRKRNYHGDYSDLKPSCVLHVRELPGHTLEIDLLDVFSVYGHIKYVSMIPDSHQALVEYYDISHAQQVVEKHRDTGIALKNGSILKVNFSTSASISLRNVDDVDQAESPILGVTVYRANYPIHTELIHKIVSQYGKPLKILIIRKKNIVAFVEFASIQEAKKVKMYLNGADVYSGCCSLKVDYAPNRPLRISQNGNEQWDANLEGTDAGQMGMNRSIARDPTGSLLGGHPPGAMAQFQTPDNNGNGAGMSMMNYVDPYARGNPAGMRFPSAMDPSQGRMMMDPNGVGNFGGPYPSRDGRFDSSSIAPVTPGPMGAASPVVLMHGIDMNDINCDKIFNIACLYGNVFRVKFLHSKEGSCMVQMGDEVAAQNLTDNLNGVYLFNKRISVQISKQALLQPVTNPYTLPDGSPSYKDFSNSSLNRFFTRDRAIKNRICRPNSTLHFWNCPPTFKDADMMLLFDHPSLVRPEQVLFFNQNEKSSSGLIEWTNPGDAINALALMNHKSIIVDESGDRQRSFRDGTKDMSSWYIKLSFGVSAIKSRAGQKPPAGIF